MTKAFFVIFEMILLFVTFIITYYFYEWLIINISVIALFGVLVCFCIRHTQNGHILSRHIKGLYHRYKLCKCGKKLRVDENVHFFHPEKIELSASKSLEGVYPSRIIIRSRVHIGAFERIASMNEVRIGDNVIFVAFGHITDHFHDYHDIIKPITEQGVITKRPVHICKGVWLAFGCHILSGGTVGENFVATANSVVTKDISPYTVVTGKLAKIVKQHDFNSGKWITVPRK